MKGTTRSTTRGSCGANVKGWYKLLVNDVDNLQQNRRKMHDTVGVMEWQKAI